jgi:hypothetical protein
VNPRRYEVDHAVTATAATHGVSRADALLANSTKYGSKSNSRCRAQPHDKFAPSKANAHLPSYARKRQNSTVLTPGACPGPGRRAIGEPSPPSALQPSPPVPCNLGARPVTTVGETGGSRSIPLPLLLTPAI